MKMAPLLRNQQNLLISLAILLFSLCFMGLGITFPSALYYDESHYIPAVRNLIQTGIDTNREHPPLAKELIAIGVSIFGDEPLGWRVMSLIFSSFTLLGVFWLALLLFQSRFAALWSTAMALLGFHVYVQARIAMLDTFMTTFLIWALVFFSKVWDYKLSTGLQKRYLFISGLFFALATACKWAALLPWLGGAALILLVFLLQSWGTSFSRVTIPARDFFHRKLFKGISLPLLFVLFIALPLFFYFLTYIPALWGDPKGPTLARILERQLETYQLQLRVPGEHNYRSGWLSWLFMIRPIWYFFESATPEKDWIRGIIFIGNPFVMWTGLIALAFTAGHAIRTRDRASVLIVSFFSFLYFGWALIPRKLSFYYYYFPAALILILACTNLFLVQANQWNIKLRKNTIAWIYLSIALVVFFYFFPLLSGMPISMEAFISKMWLRSWI